MIDKLSDLIDEMVRQTSLAPDGRDAVKGLRDRALTLEAKVEELSGKLLAFEAREGVLAEREAKVRDLELREAAATAKATALGDVFATIFGNATVRENAVRPLPFGSTQPGGHAVTGHMGMPRPAGRRDE